MGGLDTRLWLLDLDFWITAPASKDSWGVSRLPRVGKLGRRAQG